MTLEPRALGRLLRDLGVASYAIHARSRRRLELWSGRAGTAGAASMDRGERRLRTRELKVRLFSDSGRGRGESSFTISGEASEEEAEARARRAAERAAAGRGPIWALPPPAAPAQVELLDPELSADFEEALARLTHRIHATRTRAGDRGSGTVAFERAETELLTSRGFSSRYRESWVEVELEVGGEIIRQRRRRLADLDLERAAKEASARASSRAGAAALEPGEYDVVLGVEALSFEGPPYGLWQPLVTQASGELARLGLTLYQPGQSIYGDREPRGDRLTLASDGTIPFAPRSRPFGPAGEPVRRFSLVESGIARGLALDAREAGLRSALPNGGVANLVVSGGSADRDELTRIGARPRLEVVELADLETDPQSGDLSAIVGLGYLATESGPPSPVAGGVLAANLFSLLARARLSRETETVGWYRGPRAIRIDAVTIT